jgi:hypothetical protein
VQNERWRHAGRSVLRDFFQMDNGKKKVDDLSDEQIVPLIQEIHKHFYLYNDIPENQ